MSEFDENKNEFNSTGETQIPNTENQDIQSNSVNEAVNNAVPNFANEVNAEVNSFTAQAENAQNFEPQVNGSVISDTPNNNSSSDFVNSTVNMYEPPVKHKNLGLKVFCVLLAVVVFTVMGGSVGYLIGIRSKNGTTASADSTSNKLKGNVEFQTGATANNAVKDVSGKYTATGVAQIVSPSVVGIDIYSLTDTKVAAQASGIIIDKNGYILTNDHIYSEIPNAKFVVLTSDGREFDADYVAGDSRSDLAVLKIKNPSNLTPAVFGNSDSLKQGDDVIAIGNPDGLNNTVTKGIISAVNRRVSGGSSESNTPSYSMKCIQTDTAINPGNSGGALANMYGQVIGINSSKIVSAEVEGIGFSIPSNTAMKIATSLIKYGNVADRSRLGISYMAIDTVTAKRTGKHAGLTISDISLDSDLNNKGVSKNDVITKIDGKDVTNSDIVLDIIESRKPGETVTLTVYLATTGSEKTVTVKLLSDRGSSSYTTQAPTTTLNQQNPFGQ